MGDRSIGLESVRRSSDPGDGDQPPPQPLSPDAAERAKRAASYELSDAYFASAPVAGGAPGGLRESLFGRNGLLGPNCRDASKYESYDFERCDSRETIENAVLFARQSGDVEAIDPKDVRQWKMGDCSLMATLASLASTAEGRALIHGAIKEKTDGTGRVTYDVTLFKPTLFPNGHLAPVTVTVDGNFVGQHALERYAGGTREIWPLVMEQAYAVLNGGENHIARGGSPADAMMALTGKPAVTMALTSPEDWARVPPSCGGDPVPPAPYRVEDLKRDLAAHKPVVLETVGSLRGGDSQPDGSLVVYPEEYQLVKHHAYAVLDVVEDSEGHALLKLKNPWNSAEPDLVPFEELSTWFKAVDVGELP
jgi:hypothetical protein